MLRRTPDNPDRRSPSRPMGSARVRGTQLLAAIALLTGTACGPSTPPPPLAKPGPEIELDPLIRSALDRTLLRVVKAAGDPEIRRDLAFVYDANSLDSLARTEYQSLATLAPRDPLWPYRAAVCLLDLGRSDEGRAALEALEERLPGFPPALHRLALLRLSDGDLPGARLAIERCLASAPSSLPAKVTLADLHLREGDAAKARELLETVTLAAPDDRHAKFLLGRALQRTGGDETVAEVLLEEGAGAAARLVEDPREQEIARAQTGLSLEIDRGIALIQAGRPGDAVRVLEAVLGSHPDDANVLLNLSQARNAAGDLPGALSTIARATEVDPENFRVHLVRSLLELGAGDLAIRGTVVDPGPQAFEELPGMLPSNTPRPDPERTVTDADRARARGHYETALTSGARASRLGSQDHRAQFVYARAAHRAGQLEVARSALLKARDLAPDDRETIQFLFEVSFQLEDQDSALGALELLAELDPGNLVPWVNLVHLRRRAGDLDGALKALGRAEGIDASHPRVLDAKAKLDAARRERARSSSP